jgi:hypothetical protein
MKRDYLFMKGCIGILKNAFLMSNLTKNEREKLVSALPGRLTVGNFLAALEYLVFFEIFEIK